MVVFLSFFEIFLLSLDDHGLGLLILVSIDQLFYFFQLFIKFFA